MNVSIRSPHRSEGRYGFSLSFCSQAAVSTHVSIRSPHRSEGRSPCLRRTTCPGSRFQSAPPTGVRGDLQVVGGKRHDNGVSIRSPHRSEGRSDRSQRRCRRRSVFQSAPPTGVRGDLAHMGLNKSAAATCGFQSAPPTGVRGDGQPVVLVFFTKGFNPLPPPE